jgi:hypothetical protein
MTFVGLALLVSCTHLAPSIDTTPTRKAFQGQKPLNPALALVRTEPSVPQEVKTEDEKQLLALGRTILQPSWTKAWLPMEEIKPSRKKSIPLPNSPESTELYFKFLQSGGFVSNGARSRQIVSDAMADADLVTPFCNVVRRVQIWNADHLDSLYRREDATPEMYRAAIDRVWENKVIVQWAAQALRYRINAYRFAQGRVDLQAKDDDRQWAVNRAIEALEAKVRLVARKCVDGRKLGTARKEFQRSRIFSAELLPTTISQ